MVEHGNRNTYISGCRCEPCAEANRVYQRAYMKAWLGRKPDKLQAKRHRDHVGRTASGPGRRGRPKAQPCQLCEGAA